MTNETPRFRLITRPGFDDPVQTQLERILDAVGVVDVLDRLSTICDRRGEAEWSACLAHDRDNLWDDLGTAISEAMDCCEEAISSPERDEA